MKLIALYRPNSDHARKVEEYARDFERQTKHRVLLTSTETREGAATATLYDIVNYPAILILQNDGQLLKEWQGEHLPLMNEVRGYLSS